ncbi:PadR family transcriptional regulator [Pelagerythrobacter aerophilus]
MNDRKAEPHTQELTVLGLVALGKKYGFEMEEFIAQTEMQRWNEIGNSTIYKLLKDLSAKGLLTATRTPGGKGPPRNEYSLTDEGERALEAQIQAAITSERSAKLDRIVGLFFLPVLSADDALPMLKKLVEHLTAAKQDLIASEKDAADDVIGSAITGFYADLVAAEIRAVSKVIAGAETRKPSNPESA